MFKLSPRSRDSHILTVDKETFISDQRFVATIRCHFSKNIFASWIFGKQKRVDVFKIPHVLVWIHCKIVWEVTGYCQVWEDVWLYHTVNYRDQSLGCRGLRVSSELHTQDFQDHWDSPIQSLIASNVTTAAITIEFYQIGGYWPVSFPSCLIRTFNQISKTKKVVGYLTLKFSYYFLSALFFYVIILLSFYPVSLPVTGKLKLSYIAKTSQNLRR